MPRVEPLPSGHPRMTTSVAAVRPRDTSAETVAVLGIVGIGVAAVLPADHIDDGPVLCPFRRLTGLPCPGCGMTRSWVHLMHGQWHAAIWANPFGVVAMVAVVALAATVAVRRVRGRPAPVLNEVVRSRPALAVIAGWLVFSAVRLVLAI